MATSELSKVNSNSNHVFKPSGRKENLTGQRFGKLTVLYEAEHKISGRIAWVCICDCGKKKTTIAKSLKNGSTKSCGCLHIEHAIELATKNKKPIGYKRIKKQNGRVEVKTKNGFQMEHRVVAEKKIGRKLLPDEVVHHIDKDKLNNNPSNLLVMKYGEHTKLHHTGAKRSKEVCRKISENINNKKEKHPVWRVDITKDGLKKAILKFDQKKLAAEFLGITKKTLYNRINYYKQQGEWDVK